MRSEPLRLYTVPGQPVDPDLDLDKTSAIVMNDDAEAYRADRSQDASEPQP